MQNNMISREGRMKVLRMISCGMQKMDEAVKYFLKKRVCTAKTKCDLFPKTLSLSTNYIKCVKQCKQHRIMFIY